MELAVLVWQKSFIVLFPSFYLCSTHFCQIFPLPPFSAEPRLKSPNFRGLSLGGAENFSYYGIFLIFDLCTHIDPFSSQFKPPLVLLSLRLKTAQFILGGFELWISSLLHTWHGLYGLRWTTWCILALNWTWPCVLGHYWSFMSLEICWNSPKLNVTDTWKVTNWSKSHHISGKSWGY